MPDSFLLGKEGFLKRRKQYTHTLVLLYKKKIIVSNKTKGGVVLFHDNKIVIKPMGKRSAYHRWKQFGSKSISTVSI